MCQEEQERQQFFDQLLQLLHQSEQDICLIIGMRADFLGKCAEYRPLADQIDRHLVTVKPMNPEEIKEAITKPAKLVGLQVEGALITKMVDDVSEYPGSLPLLQYTLTELWNEARQEANKNYLTLDTYNT